VTFLKLPPDMFSVQFGLIICRLKGGEWHGVIY